MNMTYQDVYEEFLRNTNIDESVIDDYRPAVNPFTHELVGGDYIPNAIVIWFKQGGKIIYFSKGGK